MLKIKNQFFRLQFQQLIRNEKGKENQTSTYQFMGKS